MAAAAAEMQHAELEQQQVGEHEVRGDEGEERVRGEEDPRAEAAGSERWHFPLLLSSSSHF